MKQNIPETSEDFKSSIPENISPNMRTYYQRLLDTKKSFCKAHNIPFPQDIYQEFAMMCNNFEFHRDISFNKDKISLHSHNFIEIIYITGGNIQYLLHQHRYIIQPGDILLIPSGVSHQPLFPYELSEPYERYVLWIDKNYYRNLIKHFPDAGDCFLRCATSGEYLLRNPQTQSTPLPFAFQQGFSVCDDKNAQYSDLALSVYANTVLLWINRLSSETPLIPSAAAMPDAQEELLDKVLAYMDSHMNEKLTLEDTAAHFFVSQSTLSQLFRKYMDTSFYQHLMQNRLTFAKNRLLAGDSATKLYAQCGFSDYSSFFRAFKKNYGVSPREYLTLMHK